MVVSWSDPHSVLGDCGVESSQVIKCQPHEFVEVGDSVKAAYDLDYGKSLVKQGSLGVVRSLLAGKMVVSWSGPHSALGDCAVDGASSDIVASFAGCAGQRCMAASVLLCVGENTALLDAIVAKAGALVAGTAQGNVGAIIDGASKERIMGYIDAAERDWGARVLLDGRGWARGEAGGPMTAAGGYWVGPTVLLFTDPGVFLFTVTF